MASANSATRAKEIITDHFPNPPYHVIFRQHKGRRNAMVITIYNSALPPNEKIFSPHGYHCIRCQIYEDDPTMLHIQTLTRCELNGTENLNRLIAFSKACGLSRITLEDESKIQYATTDDSTYSDHFINLQQLQRLMTGKSWYERFGFTNEKVATYHDRIRVYIGKPIGSTYSDELVTRLRNDITSITPETSVSNAAKCIYAYLQGLCPDRICEQKDLIHIDKINDILNEMYQEMLVELKMDADDFVRLELIFSHQRGASRKNKTVRRRKRTLRG
jgi:hypothetical protein